MYPVKEALSHILNRISPLPANPIPLWSALGRVLAQDLEATTALPPFDNSAMDGFAVLAADVASPPARLQVIADIPAGRWPDFTLGPGQAARIMTGAPLPPGAEAVVPVELTDQPRGEAPLPEWVEIRQAVKAGNAIRLVGEDVQSGEVVLAAGQSLRPQDIGLLAGLGFGQVLAYPAPKVAILSTGDELLGPEESLVPGKIRDMNRYSLAAMCQQVGAIPLDLGIAGDRAAEVEGKLEQALRLGADLILSSAGVSVGTHDVVKEVMQKLGKLDFWKVNMRPGKPLAFGEVQGRPFFGLPGNPVSSLVGFEVFIRPALLKMQGRSWEVPLWPVKMGEAMNSDGRESYIRVRIEQEGGQAVAYSTGTQSSGAVSSLVRADGLLMIPAGVQSVAAGDSLYVRPFAGQSLSSWG